MIVEVEREIVEAVPHKRPGIKPQNTLNTRKILIVVVVVLASFHMGNHSETTDETDKTDSFVSRRYAEIAEKTCDV